MRFGQTLHGTLSSHCVDNTPNCDPCFTNQPNSGLKGLNHMNIRSRALSSIIIATITFSVHSASADTPEWRCDGSRCSATESLINDIETLTIATWNALTTINMPPIPWTCVREPDHCPRCLVSSVTMPPIQWRVLLSGKLRSMLIGRQTANADAFGLFQARVSGALGEVSQSWDNNSLAFSFSASNNQVLLPNGQSTGVPDLGNVNFITTSGTLLQDSIPIDIGDLNGFAWCFIGYTNQTTIQAFSTGKMLRVNYPISWTDLSGQFANAIREVFRSATRQAVTLEN